MSLSMLDTLQTNHELLLAQFQTNQHTVKSIQSTLIHEILPTLNLSEHQEQQALLYIHDSNSIFYMLRRHHYIISFTLEAISKNVEWRISNLSPALLALPSMIQCLPSTSRDPFNRPILIVNARRPATREIIVSGLEYLRFNLSQQPWSCPGPGLVLQYVILLDLKSLSFSNLDMDFIPWFMREVLPHFPGMLGAVFMINYSWAHSGLWTLLKPLLPKSALSRIFFPTQSELLQFFGEANLPIEFGGSLVPVPKPKPKPPQEQTPPPPPPPPPPIISIPPLSHLNPYFGYPTTLFAATAVGGGTGERSGKGNSYKPQRTLVHLIKTLIWLFWLRLKKVFMRRMSSSSLL